MSNSSIWSIDRILSVTTTPGQIEAESDGNEEVLHILQSISFKSFTEASLSDCLVSYLGHSLRESYPFVEMQSEYSPAPAD